MGAGGDDTGEMEDDDRQNHNGHNARDDVAGPRLPGCRLAAGRIVYVDLTVLGEIGHVDAYLMDSAPAGPATSALFMRQYVSVKSTCPDT